MRNKKRILSPIIIVIAAIILAGCQPGLKSAKNQIVKLTKEFKFNSKTTLAFVKSLESQKEFPYSVTYAYYYTYSMKALDSEIKDKYKEKIVSFIKKAQARDGGFGLNENPSSSDIYTTYCAIWTLKSLDALGQVNTAKVEKFIKSCANKDGGYGFMPGQSSLSIHTYYSVASLDVLDKLRDVDKLSVKRYLNTLQSDQGGFALRKGMPANIQSTYAALQTYKIFDDFSSVNKEKAISFLVKDQRRDGGFGYMVGDTNIAIPENALYALSSLRLLGAINKLKADSLSRFLKDRYLPADGGFCDVYYGNPKYPSTYYGIACLVELGHLTNPNIEK